MTSADYFIKRTIQGVFTFFAVMSITFAMIRLMPGGPMDFLRAQMSQQVGGQMTQAEMDRKLELFTNMHPDRPLHEQYFGYIEHVLSGDLGRSIWYNEPVAEILGAAMPWTIFISIVSLVVIYAAGVSLGAIMAYIEGSKFDISSSMLSIVITSVPFYIVAIVLVWFLGYQWGLFPISGQFGENVHPGYNTAFIQSILYYGALPIISLVLAGFGRIALSMRGNSIQTLGADYLRVARLRGLSQRRIALRYVARNAFLPMYTGMMISIGTLFGSSIILEQIFSYPGVGYYMFRAVSSRDYPLMMGTFLFITLGVIVGVYIADLTYGYVDPRAGGGGEREAF